LLHSQKRDAQGFSDGLVAYREQATELARSRYGGQVPNVTVAFMVDAIWFVNDHEAVVTYTAQISGSLNITLGGRPGRAIVVGGEWNVMRHLLCLGANRRRRVPAT
jgi:hypothetical protein